MKTTYTSDNECMLTGGLWSLIVALIVAGISLVFVDLWPAAVVIFLVVFVIGFGIAIFMCRHRTVARGGVDQRAVDIAREEMGMPAPADAPIEEAPAVETPEPEPEVEAAPEAAPAPEASEPEPAEAEHEHAAEVGEGEAKPELLSEARGGVADDLKKIKGVGPKLEKELNAAGVFHFDQIAGWTPEEIYWADNHLVSFKGRVSRDNWVEQAKDLAKS